MLIGHWSMKLPGDDPDHRRREEERPGIFFRRGPFGLELPPVLLGPYAALDKRGNRQFIEELDPFPDILAGTRDPHDRLQRFDLETRLAEDRRQNPADVVTPVMIVDRLQISLEQRVQHIRSRKDPGRQIVQIIQNDQLSAGFEYFGAPREPLSPVLRESNRANG